MAVGFQASRRLWQEFGIPFSDSQRMEPELVQFLLEVVNSMDTGDRYNATYEAMRAARANK